MNIAIIGAGFSGSYLAHKLHAKGHDVSLFEKSRGVGGRMATRYMENTQVNHGCNTIQTTVKEFQSFCDSMVEKNLLEKKEQNAYTATSINGMLKYLTKDIHLERNTLITSINYDNQQYTLKDNNNYAYKGFDFLILTIPSAQILNLDFEIDKNLADKLAQVHYDSVATLVLTGKNIAELDKIQLSKMKHLKKLYAPKDNTYVIQMDRDFSKKYRHLNKNSITPYIVQEIQRVVPNFKLYNYEYFSHLWKYGLTSKTLDLPYVYKQQENYAICGDWLMGDSVEDAFMSVENFMTLESDFLESNFMHLKELV
ncbi:MAG: Putative NAD/FAD-dependent oxidoreductase [uncultured Sulfurovum sp.]|uniref:NAD/FAD-dependent oxidoreductase n=1 Tax=uncultured Sulfurovum sp. TaxID=269237 RepID=A0A6S6STZ5_9BACT|nr:MAG: Putative NAD/FAD-dependent oxidoreductase [uncultured Sulfurovum sp.]